MCVQYREGCSILWRDTMINVGHILSTVGVFSTVGDIMSTVENYLEYRGRYFVPWGISWCTWGDIMSTVGRYNLLLFEYHHGTHDTPPTFIMISPHSIQITKDDIPHSTEHPKRYSRYPATLIHSWHWTSRTVLKISPHGTEHPLGTGYTIYRVLISGIDEVDLFRFRPRLHEYVFISFSPKPQTFLCVFTLHLLETINNDDRFHWKR